MPEVIAVHATSLDDPGQFHPQMVTYAMRGYEWDTMDPALRKFERMPAKAGERVDYALRRSRQPR